MRSSLVLFIFLAAMSLVVGGEKTECQVEGSLCSRRYNRITFIMPLNPARLDQDVKECRLKCGARREGEYIFMGPRRCLCFATCKFPIPIKYKSGSRSFIVQSIGSDPSRICPRSDAPKPLKNWKPY